MSLSQFTNLRLERCGSSVAAAIQQNSEISSSSRIKKQVQQVCVVALAICILFETKGH